MTFTLDLQIGILHAQLVLHQFILMFCYSQQISIYSVYQTQIAYQLDFYTYILELFMPMIFLDRFHLMPMGKIYLRHRLH